MGGVSVPAFVFITNLEIRVMLALMRQPVLVCNGESWGNIAEQFQFNCFHEAYAETYRTTSDCPSSETFATVESQESDRGVL